MHPIQSIDITSRDVHEETVVEILVICQQEPAATCAPLNSTVIKVKEKSSPKINFSIVQLPCTLLSFLSNCIIRSSFWLCTCITGLHTSLLNIRKPEPSSTIVLAMPVKKKAKSFVLMCSSNREKPFPLFSLMPSPG